ncbi:S-adenosylmethionine decarboxylase [Candidatus Kaiserbacteria bacterium]|nr:S-adenosylmethionine decarboxylase [Candidatus Kaiserbacteria bacterium]
MKKERKNLTKRYHIIFDAIGCDKKRISDEQFVFKLLMEIPKMIGMKILAGPNLIRDYNPDNLGITGIEIISFSHISIHTFSSTREAFVDIFSCKPFDQEKVRRYLYKELKVSPKNVETLTVKYPWER